jgi:aerobic-type carbon monoxide dehydrogenase small subunit (CoxS/CutS family)
MVQLKVNGADQSFNGNPEMPLLWYLRDVLGLTGSKFGCGIGLCGACTVHVNGQAKRSCVTAMSNIAGKEVTTVEGSRGMDCIQFRRPGCKSTCRSAVIVRWTGHAGGGSA